MCAASISSARLPVMIDPKTSATKIVDVMARAMAIRFRWTPVEEASCVWL
ncbi:hypothetical protein GCM10010988_40720 [Cnuibacter physcomitrellae]|nr:hypothetical protein GCM10010988_40720 [Cnuibacter physcomitrellae]